MAGTYTVVLTWLCSFFPFFSDQEKWAQGSKRKDKAGVSVCENLKAFVLPEHQK